MEKKVKVKIKGKKVTTTTVETRELDKYEFVCGGCQKIHKMAMYAVAQLGMGNALVFTCDCKHKTDLEPF